MAKKNVYIRDGNEAKWAASSKAKWINDALEGQTVEIIPGEPKMVYDPKLGRMVPSE